MPKNISSKWIFPFAALLGLSIVASATPAETQEAFTGAINPADTAWLLTASGLVL